MNKIFFLVVIICTVSFPQVNNSSKSMDLFSPINVKKFADYLFCQRDYLRASDEYEKYLLNNYNDTVAFKIGIANMKMGNFDIASKKFSAVSPKSVFYDLSKLEYLKANFRIGNFYDYRNLYEDLNLNQDFKYTFEARELYNFSYFFSDASLPPRNKILSEFPQNEQPQINQFYDWKSSPPYKSPLTAAILSTVVPGLGKIYTQEYSDGVFAFITVGLLGYLAYANFHANHNFRGWLFSALGTGFYGGNIYGSAASAQIYNAKISFQFFDDLKKYLEEHNYFIPLINFCK